MNVETLIERETAILAKEKGFDWKSPATLNIYEDDSASIGSYEYVRNSELLKTQYALPSQSLLQKWLREEHHLSIEIKTPDRGQPWWIAEIHKVGGYGNHFNSDDQYPSYEQALEAALVQALKLIP